jgi:hypothetical protein
MKRQTKIVPTQKGEPKFIYVSACCGAQATKTPCVRVDKKAAETQGLGSWRCPSTDAVMVTALEDAEYYTDREAGEVLIVDEPRNVGQPDGYSNPDGRDERL